MLETGKRFRNASATSGCSVAYRPMQSLRIIGVATSVGCTELTRMFFSANVAAK